MNKKIQFIRYDNDGSHRVEFNIPEELLNRYPDAFLNSFSERQRIWSILERNKFNDFGFHIVDKLFSDVDFLNIVKSTLWVKKGFNKYTTNFYFTFGDGQTVEENTKVKKQRKHKEKKKEEEYQVTFKSIRTKMKNKIKLLMGLNHWEDPQPVPHSHKSFVIVGLTIRNRNTVNVLNITTIRDTYEKMEIRLRFLDKPKNVVTADDAIAAIEEIFGNDLSTIMNVYLRIESLN